LNEKIIVPDSNVFIKLFVNEKDSQEAKNFFITCAEMNLKLVVPELFKYEIAETTRDCGQPLQHVFDALDKMTRSILTATSPNQATWNLAEEITQHGHPKSGFASMYDSIFHAVAINSGGVFVTADHRHYAKAKEFGHITLFKDWETIFISQ